MSENCIYLINNNSQIWIDYGIDGDCNDFYFYKNNKIIYSSYYFTFYKGFLLISDDITIENPISWKYDKNDRYSIIINNDIYYIDKNNATQVYLFDELNGHIFTHLHI
jgi:hypothetical protein